jgi:Domain of unknown function (DUF4382)
LAEPPFPELPMRIRLISVSLLCLGWMLACGGGGGGSQPAPPTGSLTLRFGSDSFPIPTPYDQVFVSLEKVDGSPDGTNWVALGNVQATYNLLVLQNGNSAVIVPAAKVTPGTYKQFRITWAIGTYPSSALSPGYLSQSTTFATQTLSMPTTTIVSGLITVPANGSTTAQIMLSGQQAVQFRAAAQTSGYTFQATGSVYDLSSSATITGHLEFGTTPLAGAEVFAETLDGTLLASIQRRAFTDATGKYILEGLPIGSGVTYFVASQPVIASGAYPAAAAALPVIASTATTYTADLAVNAASQSPGSLTLTITPASTASQGTWGELRQSLSTGGGNSQILIVRSQSVATGQAQDQTGIFGLIPGASYGLTVQRSTAGATPVMKTGTAFSVGAGGFATQTLSYP